MTSSRSRGWCFTVNNPMDSDYVDAHVLAESGAYGILGTEVGEEGTTHIQGYVYFTNARSLQSVSAVIPRAHFEQARGSPKQNQKYCSKGEAITEYGEPLKLDKQVISDQVAGMIASGSSVDEIKESYPGFYLLHARVIDAQIKASKKVESCMVIECKESEIVGHTPKGYTLCIDIDTYDGEDVLAIPTLTGEHPIELRLGAQWKIRRGFELIKVQPKILLLYKD